MNACPSSLPMTHDWWPREAFNIDCSDSSISPAVGRYRSHFEKPLWLTKQQTVSPRKHVRTDGLFEAYQSARNYIMTADENQLREGFLDAVAVLNSGLFPDYIQPRIGVDEYGEFLFTFKSDMGYADIGVNGENEISYHVRHDSNPILTSHGDCDWDRIKLPDGLIESFIALLNDGN